MSKMDHAGDAYEVTSRRPRHYTKWMLDEHRKKHLIGVHLSETQYQALEKYRIDTDAEVSRPQLIRNILNRFLTENA